MTAEDMAAEGYNPHETRAVARVEIHWPETLEDLQPPSDRQFNAECEAVTRDHFDEISTFWKEAEKGKASVYGSFDMTQSILAVRVKQIATANGYSSVAAKNEHQILLGMRRALPKVTKIKPRDLKKNAVAFDLDIRKRLQSAAPATPQTDDQQT